MLRGDLFLATDQESYLRGRLEGLYQLVDILRGLVESKDAEKSQDMIKTVVMHVYDELGNILDGLRDSGAITATAHKAAVKVVVTAKKELPKAATAAPHVEKSKDLMKDLLNTAKK